MKINGLLLLVPAFLCTACALPPKRSAPAPAGVIAQPSEADQLLAYLMPTRKLDARDFLIEREQVRNAFRADKSEFNRVKLALLLATMPAPAMSSTTVAGTNANASDDAELIALLEPMLNTTSGLATGAPVRPTNTELRGLAMLMHSLALDRKKLREQWREAQARLNALRRDDTKDVEMRGLRAHVEELERKLAALKSIDRSVNRRSEVQRVEPPRVELPK